MTTQTPAGVDPDRWATAVARFSASHVVDPRTGCWIGRERPNTHGYIQVWLCGRRWLAHRLAYALRHGPIPEGLNILHECDNRLCRNPDHLRAGTQRENLQDAKERGRLPSGPGSNPRKLTGRDAVTIQGLRWFDKLTLAQLAEAFSVSVWTIQAVLSGKVRANAIEAEHERWRVEEAAKAVGAAADSAKTGAGQPDRPSRPADATGGL